MKSSLFQKNLLDNDTLLSAVKKAQGKAGVLGNGVEQTILGKATNSATKSTIISQSKIDRVEDRLNYLDKNPFKIYQKMIMAVVPRTLSLMEMVMKLMSMKNQKKAHKLRRTSLKIFRTP